MRLIETLLDVLELRCHCVCVIMSSEEGSGIGRGSLSRSEENVIEARYDEAKAKTKIASLKRLRDAAVREVDKKANEEKKKIRKVL